MQLAVSAPLVCAAGAALLRRSARAAPAAVAGASGCWQ
jgi:hypothetical protein